MSRRPILSCRRSGIEGTLMYDLTIDDFPPDRLAAMVHWRNDPAVNRYVRPAARFRVCQSVYNRHLCVCISLSPLVFPLLSAEAPPRVPEGCISLIAGLLLAASRPAWERLRAPGAGLGSVRWRGGIRARPGRAHQREGGWGARGDGRGQWKRPL